MMSLILHSGVQLLWAGDGKLSLDGTSAKIRRNGGTQLRVSVRDVW